MLDELSVLVVEEHGFDGEMIVESVRRLKPKDVYSANGSREALELVSSTAVDLVIADIDTPAMDGLEFMRCMAEGGNSSSVIVASSIPPPLLASTEAMIREFGINLLGIVQKPVTDTALQTLVARQTPGQLKAEQGGSGTPFSLDDIAEGLRQGQFEPYFQPKVELATRRVVGAEALARWCHPHRGVLAPAAFMKLIEGEAGCSDDLLWLMLRKSAAFSSKLKEVGHEASVGLKLSVQSLGRAGFAERAAEFARAHGIDPQRICLEITEAAVAARLEPVALENLKRLREAGFLLAVDDFGTGRATQAHLAHVPLTDLKIARLLVTGADLREDARSLLEASLRLAAALKVRALAEGVETQQDWDLLQELGCDYAQGYFIAKPMPAEAYLQWMSDLATDPTSIFVA